MELEFFVKYIILLTGNSVQTVQFLMLRIQENDSMTLMCHKIPRDITPWKKILQKRWNLQKERNHEVCSLDLEIVRFYFPRVGWFDQV